MVTIIFTFTFDVSFVSKVFPCGDVSGSSCPLKYTAGISRAGNWLVTCSLSFAEVFFLFTHLTGPDRFSELVKAHVFLFLQHCGSKYLLQSERKMYPSVSSKVKFTWITIR